jgi:hypothetical protein
MKAILRVFALLMCVSWAWAEFDGLPDYVKANMSAVQKYPRASNILLWAKETYTLNADGAQIYEWHAFRWIPDEAARDNWGDPHVTYRDGKQQLDILTARTYTRDGRKIDSTPQNAFNSIIPENGQDKAPDYSDFRQMVITLLGLENGCVSELHYRLTTATPLWPWIEGRIYFRESYPVIAHELAVTVPQGTKLNYRSDRGAPEPAINGTVYAWKATEQKGYLEEDLRGHRMLLPNVAFSSAKDWPQVSGELKARLQASMAGDIVPPASLKKALAQATSDEARLDTIKTWVRERCNKLEFEHPEFGLTLRSAGEILQTGYGNSLELAVLVAKLADAVGVQVQVAAMFLPDAPVPSLATFHGALLCVKLDGLRFYCDPLEPRSEFTQTDLLGSVILDSTPDTEQPEAFSCRTKLPYMNLTLAIDDLSADTLHGHGTFSAYGEWGVYEKARADGAEQYLNDFARLNGFAVDEAIMRTLEPARMAANVVVDFTFHAAALDTAEGRHILALNALDFAPYVKDAPLMLSAREFPQWIPLPGEITLRMEAPVPDGWAMERKPATGTKMWDWSEGRTRCDVADGRMIFERTLKLAREWIAPDGWLGFRAWMLDSGPCASNSIIFQTQ